jgi:hypothetical protein
LTEGRFQLCSSVQFSYRILARGGPEFGGGEIALAADLVTRPPAVRISRLQRILFLDTSVEPALTPGEIMMAMFRLGKWVVVGLAVWMLAAQEAKAGVGFQPVSPDELKMTSEPLAPGAPAIILYRQVDRDDYEPVPREDNYVRIKILTEEGRKYANVEIPFLEGRQDVWKLKARTIKPNGAIADFDGKVLEKELVKVRGVKYKAKTFTLPDVQVGTIVEYFYAVNFLEGFIPASHWILSEELFTKKAQFSLKPYPGRSVAVSWTWQRLPPGTTAPEQGKDRVVRMEASNIPAFQTEDFMPPPNELKSRVDFVYERGLPEKDQDSFWKRVGKERNEQLESFVGKQKAMEQAVAQIVSPNDPQDVKLRKIYDRVQQIRNKTYELRKTEQEEKREKEKKDENVEDVWKRGYGNRTQLNWLFLGLARAAGFEAYGCWVSDRKEYFFTPATRQSARLDVNVVLVKLNGKDLYLAPGAAFTPFGLLPWWESDVPGLLLDKDGGTWIETTLPQASESRIERVGKLKLSETGDLEGKLTVTYLGQEALNRREEERNADEVARKKSLERHVTSLVGVPAEAELTNQPDWIDSETPLVAAFNLKVPGWASNAGKRVVIPAVLFDAADKGLFEREHRVHPIYFEYPHGRLEDVTIELPPGWQVSSVPPPQDQNKKVMSYSLKVEQGPGTVRLTRTLTVDFLLVEQKYYTALRNFFQAVRTGDGQQIVLQPGESHASN